MPAHTNAEKLAEAEAALHALLTGRAASVVVDQNGERVEYARASLARLQGYVTHLRTCVKGVAARPHVIRFQTSKGL